jgi:hypothetical protein
MRKIFPYMFILAFIPALAIQSPLSSFNDYIFTEPVNTNFIQGSILGPNPPNYGPVRGEDSIYLYEAYSEMYTLLSAGPSTVRTRAPGIDTTYMRIDYAALTGRPSYQDIYYLFYNNTNGVRDVITKKNVTVSMPTNVIQLSNYYTYPSYMAGNAAVYSGAAMTAAESLKPLGTSPRVRYLAVTNVAAYYAELKKVSGIAKDFTSTEGTNYNYYTTRHTYDEYTFSDGSFSYDEISTESHPYIIGGGLYEITLQSSGRVRIYDNGTYYISRALHSSTSGNCIADDDVSANLFSTSMVRASQITPKKGWISTLVTYSRTETKWLSPTNNATVVNIQTNFAVVIESQVQISERDGTVVATLTPNYVSAYNAFFSANPSFPYPDDIDYPAAPVGSSAFAADETGSKYNDTETIIRIKPVNVSLVLDIAWHTGFNQN